MTIVIVKIFNLYWRRTPMGISSSSPFSYYSYYDNGCCITHNITRKGSKHPEPQCMAGRIKLKRYPFEGSGCKFPETLTQRIVTNLKVPILAGAPPPRYPGDEPDDGC